jgi:hypothetical protein
MIAATPGTWSWAGSTQTIDIQQINQIIGTWSWAGSNSPPAVQQINAAIGTWSWAGSAATIEVPQINQAIGTWSWAGTTQTITTPGGITEINQVPGTWSWAGSTATIEIQQITHSIGTWSWAGTTQTFNQLIDAIPGTWSWVGSTATIEGTVVEEARTTGVPGWVPWVVYINGRRYVGTKEQIQILIDEFAEEQVEQEIKGRKPKRVRIVVKPGKEIPGIKTAKQVETVAKQVQTDFRQYYDRIRATAKARFELDEEEAIIALLQ